MTATLQTSPLTRNESTPSTTPSAGNPNHLGGQRSNDTHQIAAPEGQALPPGQHENKTQERDAGLGDPLPLPAKIPTAPMEASLAGEPDVPGDQTRDDTQYTGVSGATTSPTTCKSHPGKECSEENGACPEAFLRTPGLGLLASTVLDLENLRKGLASRVRLMLRPDDETDKDDATRGLGMSPLDPQVIAMQRLLIAIGGPEIKKLDDEGNVVRKKDGTPVFLKQHGEGGLEHQAVLDLRTEMRHHPLWKTWGVHQKGIGEKLLARLLGTLGDPYWIDSPSMEHRPRTRSQLFSYCGYAPIDGKAAKMRKGQKVTWSPEARMRTHLLVPSVMKQKGHYYDVYKAAKVKYSTATHTQPCDTCTGKGKPAAPVGSPVNPMHQEGMARHLTAKVILEDLWNAAKALHEERDKISLPTKNAATSTSTPSAGD